MKKILRPDELGNRVPPGQTLTDKFPVLSYGPAPRFDPAQWDFRVVGMVQEPLRFDYHQFRALPQTKQISDFHCVTTWSRLDNQWEGVSIKDLMTQVKLTPEAAYV